MNWDMEVMMPEQGSKARARQLATLSRIVHELRTSDETGRLLEAAEQEMAGAPYDSDEAAMLRVARHDYEQNTKLPADFVSEFTKVTAEAHDIWAKARADSNFRHF